MSKFPVILAYSAACGLAIVPIQAAETHDVFFDALTALCGNKYQGEVVESIESDASWREALIIMDVSECSEDQISIPLSVGEDTSRTWIITREGDDLTLKHDHRHADGTPDEVTMYGGTANDIIVTIAGEYYMRQFPADQFSKDMFVENGLEVSVNNTWVLAIEPGNVFSYRLQRPGRTFQIDFDLTNPVE